MKRDSQRDKLIFEHIISQNVGSGIGSQVGRGIGPYTDDNDIVLLTYHS